MSISSHYDVNIMSIWCRYVAAGFRIRNLWGCQHFWPIQTSRIVSSRTVERRLRHLQWIKSHSRDVIFSIHDVLLTLAQNKERSGQITHEGGSRLRIEPVW